MIVPLSLNTIVENDFTSDESGNEIPFSKEGIDEQLFKHDSFLSAFYGTLRTKLVCFPLYLYFLV